MWGTLISFFTNYPVLIPVAVIALFVIFGTSYTTYSNTVRKENWWEFTAIFVLHVFLILWGLSWVIEHWEMVWGMMIFLALVMFIPALCAVA